MSDFVVYLMRCTAGEKCDFGARLGGLPGRMKMKMSQTVTPYLTIKGAANAIEFYKKAFGATENSRMPAQDGKRIMHADLALNGGSLFLSDEFPEHGGSAAPSQGSTPPVAVALALTAPADVDKTFKQAASAGAQTRVEPTAQILRAP